MLTLVLVSFQQIWGGKRWWHGGLILVNMHVTKMAQELCVGHLQTFSRVKPVEMSLSSSWQEPGGGGSVPASGELCLVSTDKLWMIERWAHVRLHTWVIPAASSSPPCECVSVCVHCTWISLRSAGIGPRPSRGSTHSCQWPCCTGRSCTVCRIPSPRWNRAARRAARRPRAGARSSASAGSGPGQSPSRPAVSPRTFSHKRWLLRGRRSAAFGG